MVKLPLNKLIGTSWRIYPAWNQELIKSMHNLGLMVPITVRPVPRKGWFWMFKARYYEILDGFARVEVAKLLNWSFIDAEIVNITDAQVEEFKKIRSY